MASFCEYGFFASVTVSHRWHRLHRRHRGHIAPSTEFGQGAVDLAVEHVLVTYDAEEGIAVGERGDEGAASAAEGLVVFGGAALRAKRVDSGLQGADDVG